MKSLIGRLMMVGFVLGLAIAPMAVGAQGGGSLPVPGLDVALIDDIENVIDTDVTGQDGEWDLMNNANEDGLVITIDVSGVSDDTFHGMLEDASGPLDGYLVHLRDAQDCLLDSDVTDANGEYTLSAGFANTGDEVIINPNMVRPGILSYGGSISSS